MKSLAMKRVVASLAGMVFAYLMVWAVIERNNRIICLVKYGVESCHD